MLSSPLELNSVTNIDDLEVVYTDKTTEIAGVVYDSTAPVAGATVVVFPAQLSQRGVSGQHPDRVRAFRANGSGAFHLGALPPGEYLIAAIDEATADGWQDPRQIDIIRARAKRLTFQAGDHVSMDLQLVTRR